MTSFQLGAALLDEFTAGAMMPKPQAHELLSNMYGLDRPLATSVAAVYPKGVYVNSWDGTELGHLGRIPDLIESSTERTLLHRR